MLPPGSKARVAPEREGPIVNATSFASSRGSMSRRPSYGVEPILEGLEQTLETANKMRVVHRRDGADVDARGNQLEEVWARLGETRRLTTAPTRESALQSKWSICTVGERE